jgi:Flp pilus assembly protein CpaB
MILIAALVVGALAAVALFNYVGGVEDKASKDAKEVRVLVLKKDVPRGLTGKEAVDKGFIVSDKIPTKFKPATAVDDSSTIQSFVAITDLAAGSVLVRGMFVSKEEAKTGNAELLKNGNVAITISVDNVRGVAGLIVPGDFVNILVIPKGDICDALKQNQDTASNAPVDLSQVTAVLCTPARYLYQKVQVLFVDKTAEPQPGTTPDNGTATPTTTAANTGLITFSVPPAAAQFIASVGNDQIYLSLVAPDFTPIQLPPLDPLLQVLPGEDPNQLTPYGPQGLQEG